MINSRAYLFALISALLFGLSWNGLLPAISLFFAFLPLLYLIQNASLHYTKVFNFAVIAFFGFHLGTVWWLSVSSVFGSIVIIVLNSMLMALVWVLIFKTRQIFGMSTAIFSFIIYWLSFEYIHYHWELSWPFMNLGNWLGQLPKWVQWYEYTGVPGGTLWIILVNIVLYLTLAFFFKKQYVESVIFVGLGISLFIMPVLWSENIYNHYEEHGKRANFVIIQPNIDPYTEKYDTALFKEQIKNQIKLAKEIPVNKIDGYIFPESSFPVYLNEDNFKSSDFFQFIGNKLITDTGFTVIGGLYSFRTRGEDTIFYNTAFLLGRSGHPQLYHKSKLVIGVEKMPFQKYFSFLKKWNLNFGGFTSSLGIDNERKVFNFSNQNLKIAPVICYESVYGEFVTEFIQNGASCIAVITNDGWWGDTPGYKQHLMHSQLRAIENRRAVVRAANTGVSCFINQKGEIISQIDSWKEYTLKGSILVQNNKTFYAKNGDFIGRIALFMSIVLLTISMLYALVTKLKQNK